MRPRSFYGWVIVLVAGLCYGLGMSPVYYSWGIFAPRLVSDLGVDRGDVGGVFGLFSVLYQCVGVLVGLAITRLTLRTSRKMMNARIRKFAACVTNSP